MKTFLVLALSFIGSAFCQTAKVGSENTTGQVWEIPFASSDNTLSLGVMNNSKADANNVSVTFLNAPSWMKFESGTFMIKVIPAGGSGEAEFRFSVDRKAPTGRDTIITATITTPGRQVWTKGVKVSVAAPRDYRLYDNFPNPFNPSTKIAFELPKASHIRLIIYDIVGREVAQVADGNYPAGYTELTWNGLNKHGEAVSSGVYFYRISTDNWSKVRKMMLLK